MTPSTNAVTKFLTELSLHFGKRFDSDEAEDQWLDSMQRNLRVYSPSVLERACRRIVDTRKDRYFPLPAECRTACEEVIKLEKAETAPRFDETAKAKAFADSHDWKTKLADDLIMCSLGKQAAQEGWILSLHDFCRLNGRLPTQYWEQKQCVDAARGFDRAYEDVLNGMGGVCSKALERLGDTMLKRREELRVRVLGKDAA